MVLHKLVLFEFNYFAGELKGRVPVSKIPILIQLFPSYLSPLQTDIGPFPHNRTDSSTSDVAEGGSPERSADPRSSAAGPPTDRPWKMEDVEGELERKVELLEKERKALRLEAEKHRHEIDWSINKLQHRISGLEEGRKQKIRKDGST